ncbi:MAG: hypothetical protein ACI4C1_08590 [Lachnospiraceae bacterium]
MKIPRLANTLGYIDDKLISEAANSTRIRKQQTRWLKWSAAAACFILAAVLIIGILQGKLFGNNTHIATLENGNTLAFVKTDSVGIGQFDMERDMEGRKLTDSEIDLLFEQMPVSGTVYFNNENNQFAALEGKLGNVTLTITAPGVSIADTIIVGEEQTSEVDGVSVAAGYFITRANSKGKRNIIYYATFELGENIIYVEYAGSTDDSTAVRTEIAAAIQDLIHHGEINFHLISVKN